jgi:hypothetical protein
MNNSARLDNYRKRAMQLICGCCLISLYMCAYAQVGNQGTFVGRLFWYEPSHDNYVATEFYSSPNINGATTRIPQKTRIQVVAAQRGWFAIQVGAVSPSAPVVYIPIRMFLFRLYPAGSVIDSYTAKDVFMRASIFEDDPDVLKTQFEKKDKDATTAPAPKPSVKLKPWQKYKENWGGITPPPKKNKNLLLDPIKPPDQADEPP